MSKQVLFDSSSIIGVLLFFSLLSCSENKSANDPKGDIKVIDSPLNLSDDRKDSISRYVISDSARVLIEAGEARFNSWLKDTLKVLRRIPDSTNTTFYRHISVAEDSLSLILNYYYADQLNPRNMKGKRRAFRDMASLLAEYGELPKGPFNLKFTLEDFYYPSVIDCFRYDFVEKVRNFEVEETHKKLKSKYSIIRGRINNKEVKSIHNGVEKVVQRVDFNWHEGKLVKVPYTLRDDPHP